MGCTCIVEDVHHGEEISRKKPETPSNLVLRHKKNRWSWWFNLYLLTNDLKDSFPFGLTILLKNFLGDFQGHFFGGHQPKEGHDVLKTGEAFNKNQQQVLLLWFPQKKLVGGFNPFENFMISVKMATPEGKPSRAPKVTCGTFCGGYNLRTARCLVGVCCLKCCKLMSNLHGKWLYIYRQLGCFV